MFLKIEDFLDVFVVANVIGFLHWDNIDFDDHQLCRQNVVFH